MGILRDFKEFINKGSVVDLAVAVIVGGAFGKIVTSLVNDIIMPPVGKAMGGLNFGDLFVNLDPAKRLPGGEAITSLAQAKAAGVAVVAYGQFINAVVDFLIVSFCVFVFVKAASVLKPAPPAPAAVKDCPFCLSSIPTGASRCPHCTSQLNLAR
jgi:large conductance mechanosensitive channel